MTKRSIVVDVALVVLVALAAGCTSLSPSNQVTLSDMKTAVADLVAKMQDDEGFRAHYDRLASQKEDLPVLQIATIENYTADRVSQKLESARRRLEIALRKTRLFDIVDDAASAESVSKALADTLVANANAGLKGNEGLQSFGQHASADYQIFGRYRTFADGERHIYELTLQLIDLASGKQVWSDVAEIDKE